MENECCDKYPDHSNEMKRLNRLAGQVDGIKKMIDDRRYCIDIINQLKAVRSAAQSIEANILKKHFEACITEAFSQKDIKKREEKMNEIIHLYKKNN